MPLSIIVSDKVSSIFGSWGQSHWIF